eukprot:271424_1
MDDDNVSVKCVVVGDYDVNKAHICSVFGNPNIDFTTHKQTVFDNATLPTETKSQTTVVNIDSSWISGDEYKTQNVALDIDLWDTTGQEEFDRIRPLSYREADVFIAIFNSIESMQSVAEKWSPEIHHHSRGQPNVQFALIHASDWKIFNEIDPEQVTNLAKTMGAKACIAIDLLNKDSIQYVRSRVCELVLDASDTK